MKYSTTIKIKNYDDVLSFSKSLIQIPEFRKLSMEEKLKIIYAYPFRLDT